jgi:hypothetical protein
LQTATRTRPVGRLRPIRELWPGVKAGDNSLNITQRGERLARQEVISGAPSMHMLAKLTPPHGRARPFHTGPFGPVARLGARVIFAARARDLTPASESLARRGERLTRLGVISSELWPNILADPRPRKRANLLVVGRLRPQGRPETRVISSARSLDITSAELRSCPGRYSATSGSISPVIRKRSMLPVCLGLQDIGKSSTRCIFGAKSPNIPN